MADTKEGYSATAAPIVIGDLVISGVAGGEEGARGFVDAYRTATGERAWRFWTIPKRGEKGSETWIGNALEHGCRATWITGWRAIHLPEGEGKALVQRLCTKCHGLEDIIRFRLSKAGFKVNDLSGMRRIEASGVPGLHR